MPRAQSVYAMKRKAGLFNTGGTDVSHSGTFAYDRSNFASSFVRRGDRPGCGHCKDYFTACHQCMFDISAAVQKALKDDPKISALNDKDMDIKVDQVCKAHPDAKIIDALHS
jgi:hypothetical protein